MSRILFINICIEPTPPLNNLVNFHISPDFFVKLPHLGQLGKLSKFPVSRRNHSNTEKQKNDFLRKPTQCENRIPRIKLEVSTDICE